MSTVSKEYKENTVKQNILQMKVNKFLFELEKKVKEELDEKTEDIEEDIIEQSDMIEAYKEIYSEEDDSFEMPELEEEHKERILENKIKEVNNNIWDVETSIKVFKKVGNKERRKNAEDNLVKLNKRLEILESME